MSSATALSRKDTAETGRILLDNLHINSGDVKRLGKRQISGSAVAATATYENKFQRINFLGARKPGVIPQMWSAQEDESLRAAVKKHGEKNWRLIAEDIPGRNHLQCLQRWKKALRPGLVKGHWSKEEDKYLLSLIKSYTEKGAFGNINWAAIAQQIEGRNAKQCRERWFLNLDPSINRGPWTADEDRRLLELAAQCGGRWSLIAKNMEGRTENSVKTRFHSLQRQEARNRGWTPEEDEGLLNATLLFGRDWTKIVKQLPGRSRGQLKKRFAILTQHRPDLVRQVQTVEDNIQSGKQTVPNPPPPPIGAITAPFLHRNGPSAAAGPAAPAAPSRQQQQASYQQQQWQQQQQGFAPPNVPGQQYYQQGAPGAAQQHQRAVAAAAQQKKGMFRKYGSSWMAGIVDNLDTNNQAQLNAYQSDLGHNMKRTNSQNFMKNEMPAGLDYNQPGIHRQDTSNMALLDKLLTEQNGGGAAEPPAGFDQPNPSLGGEARSKGLKQYNSWGSIGAEVGGGGAGLFNGMGPGDMSATGAPAVMRTGSTKGMKKMPSSSMSNWGNPQLATYESTSDIKNFLNML
mmetsp:Transcript_7288/g.13066  ORF Transcript_7288/g.13066 Transcript_7288/m.13066 type:complete len:572 (+) Transcript_7288:6507-8222(+)|eukprot:CAMPEP_0203748922 /NCGR_PEP_ID=MMETSP0098-20131031/3655_1 /ASSEMBLY_ACC=CAM_ASM_000208 /TAXON_ID=96639 /ORGANISM=" , Strain NY0313808BC1" /LENGTH=571 /DNA_ID=CAMNT_0050637839 /DNA_START=275 /DNA_END=1990 /DNA_ORIENTATION=-